MNLRNLPIVKCLVKKQEYLYHHINWWISLVNLDHLKVMAYMYCCLIKKSQRILSNRLRLPQNGRKMTKECMNVSIQNQKVIAYALP